LGALLKPGGEKKGGRKTLMPEVFFFCAFCVKKRGIVSLLEKRGVCKKRAREKIFFRAKKRGAGG